MNKTDRKYSIALAIIAIVVVAIRLIQPDPIDWSEGYAKAEKKPFGSYILFNTLSTLFPARTVTTNTDPIYLLDAFEKRGNFIFINGQFSLDKYETEILINRVKKGDNVFVAAREFGGYFADSLNLSIYNSVPFIDPDTKTLDDYTQKGINFTNPSLRADSAWQFPNQLVEAYFTSFDSSRTTVLGTVGEVAPNFIQVSYGRGSFFINSSPFLFTNYFLRDTTQYTYAYHALSYLPQANTMWDEYYKIGRLQFSTPMQFIATQPALKWAWFIALAGLLLFLIFGGKRLQRVIPEIAPVSNTSIDFATTIANMYLNAGSHRDILNKKITFFMDYLRTNLRVNTTKMDAYTRQQIAQRSGLALDKINQLVDDLDTVDGMVEVSSRDLKRITDQIDNFYKTTQR